MSLKILQAFNIKKQSFRRRSPKIQNRFYFFETEKEDISYLCLLCICGNKVIFEGIHRGGNL